MLGADLNVLSRVGDPGGKEVRRSRRTSLPGCEVFGGCSDEEQCKVPSAPAVPWTWGVLGAPSLQREGECIGTLGAQLPAETEVMPRAV